MRTLGLTMRVVEAEGYAECRDALSADWPGLFETGDFVPLLLPNQWEVAVRYFEQGRIDAVVLTGGNSLGPVLGGVDASAGTRRRDIFEKQLLEYTTARRIPVIGVCRGMQVINAFYGGTLSRVAANVHVAKTHEVALVEAFQNVFPGFTKVNSYHEFGITPGSLGRGLVPFAMSTDGIVEGLVSTEAPVMATMDHPERQAGQRELFFRNIERMIKEGMFWKGSI
ncbi:MAG: C26 family cysteine hydrolase domain-containing family [Candidatus Omnitrophica bacterium]|nr:C26 family cysteine hydrolase domain-containing family [Candidatus Omnitrophota bacterium]